MVSVIIAVTVAAFLALIRACRETPPRLAASPPGRGMQEQCAPQVPRESRALAAAGKPNAPSVRSREEIMTSAQLTFDQIRAFLDAAEIRHDACDEQRAIHTGFELPAGRFLMAIHVDGDPTFVLINTDIPIRVPEDRRPQMAEAIVRANFGTVLGRFELDMSSGRLSFRVAMPAGEAGITQPQFDCLMRASLWSANRYFRAFGRLLFGDDLSPAEVIAEVEMAE